MRIVTLNAFGHHGDYEARQDVLRAGLQALEADVLTLQETIATRHHDQVGELLGPTYQVVHQPGRSADGVGASIASRWPMEVVLEADLHTGDRGDPTGWIGSLVVVRVHARQGPVLVAHHKPTWESHAERVRERQAVAAARLLEELVAPSDALVLAGDFDSAPDASSVRFWTGRQSLEGMSVAYQDAWEACHPDEPGHTFTPMNDLVSDEWRPRRGRRIDYLLVRCGAKGAALDIVSCERIFDAQVNGVWASDHFGVVADLVPNPPERT